jgi:hypothetical protein
MNRLGILIDITHASGAAQTQIIQASEAPVVASHLLRVLRVRAWGADRRPHRSSCG